MALLQMIFVMTRAAPCCRRICTAPGCGHASAGSLDFTTSSAAGGYRCAAARRRRGLRDVRHGRHRNLLFVGPRMRDLTRRRLRRARSQPPAPERQRTGSLDRLTRSIARHPVSRGVLEFTLHSLARSRSHRLLIAIYVGVALALVVSALCRRPSCGAVCKAFATPSSRVLSAPFVIGFFALVGTRVASRFQSSRSANWLFRCASRRSRAAMSGVRDRHVVVGVVPTILIALTIAATSLGAHGLHSCTPQSAG